MVGLAGLLPHKSPHIFMHIEERGKSLIIRWRVDSKKYHKSLKNHNNPIGWKNANSLKESIEGDILKTAGVEELKRIDFKGQPSELNKHSEILLEYFRDSPVANGVATRFYQKDSENTQARSRLRTQSEI